MQTNYCEFVRIFLIIPRDETWNKFVSNHQQQQQQNIYIVIHLHLHPVCVLSHYYYQSKVSNTFLNSMTSSLSDPLYVTYVKR